MYGVGPVYPQCNLRATGKFTKWIGLRCPVKAIRAVGVLLQTVFAALVIVSNTNLAEVHFVMVRYGCDQIIGVREQLFLILENIAL